LYGAQAGIGVVRLQRELRGNSNVAVMATSTDFGPTHNRVYSLDTRLQLLPNWILTGQAMSSDTRLRDGQHLAGPAYYLLWAHSGKHFISETAYSDRSPGFRAQLGYFNRVDIREASHTVGYKWRPEGRSLVSFGPKLKGMINYDRSGRLQDWSVNPEFEIELTRMTEIALERWRDSNCSPTEASANTTTRRRSRASGRSGFPSMPRSATAAVSTIPREGLQPFLGNLLEAQGGFTLRPSPRIKIDESYIYNAMKTNSESGLAEVPSGTSIFNNHIVRSKANYQFNREMSLRVIVDYNSVLPNSTLVDLDKEKHFGVDALFTYMLNPGTAFYVGYTDLYDNWRLDPTRSPNLIRTDFPGLNTGRQFFVKLSYLFRF